MTINTIDSLEEPDHYHIKVNTKHVGVQAYKRSASDEILFEKTSGLHESGTQTTKGHAWPFTQE